MLARVALRPRMRWYGPWYPDATIEQTARAYLANVTGGRDDVLGQVAIFRLDPWEDAACRSLPTAAQQASYKRWIDGFAAGIGATRVALVLQPDLPFAFCVPHHSQLPLHMVAYAARVFSALPHTTVYIDAGAADWPTVGQAVGLLRAAGVRYARGFALNATHYDATGNEIRFAAAVARGLARAGSPGRHAVINTSSNGRGFTFQQYHGPDFNNATPCASRTSRRCVTLGIPPTANVASPQWGLSARQPPAGRPLRRRLPVDRAPVAVPPVRPVPAPAGDLDGPHHPVLEPGRRGSQLALVEVHDRPVGPALAVDEPEALVQRPGHRVGLARAQQHVVAPALAAANHGRLHQRAPEAVTAPRRDDVELGQIALEPLGPDRALIADDRQARRGPSPTSSTSVSPPSIRTAIRSASQSPRG